MDPLESSQGLSASDISNSEGTSLDTRQVHTKHDIRDYFTRKSTPSSSQPSQKKVKITADNGRDMALRQSQAKRVKRESTAENLVGTETVVRTARAKLRFVLSVPLDVLFEIFCHLMPLDILRLSRTTKELRGLLLHRSSTFIWKAALKNVPELPACPDDVSLPFWTNLVFDHHCQNCLTTNVKRFNFYLRVRYCNKCWKRKLIPDWSFSTDGSVDKMVLQCIPFSHWNESTERYCTVADRDQFLAEITASAKSLGHKFEKKRFIDFKKAGLAIRLGHTRECKAWMRATTSAREHELESIRSQREVSIRIKLMDMGYSSELVFLDQLDADICSIVPWPNIARFYEYPHIRPCKPLTERVWLNIKDDMVDYMKQVGDLMLENRRCLIVDRRRVLIQTVYNKWRTRSENLERHPPHMPMPGAADILEFHPIKGLLNLPPSVELNPEMQVIPTFEHWLEREIKDWREDCLYALMNMVVNSRACRDLSWRERPYADDRTLREKLRPFERAVVVFRCTHRSMHWRHEEARLRADVVYPPGTPVDRTTTEAALSETHAPVLWYPQFLHHTCTAMQLRTFDERLARTDGALCTGKQFADTRQAPWDATRLEFDDKAARATRNILEACGMDWKTATTKELDVRDPRVVCLKCSFGARCDGERRVRVWAWRDAVQHCLSAHFGDGLVTWECISDEDTAEARRLDALECTSRGFYPPAIQKIWRCITCRDTAQDGGRVSWAALQAHFRLFPLHGNADDLDGKENIVYYRDLDSFPREGPAVKMIPSPVPLPSPVAEPSPSPQRGWDRYWY